MSKSVVLHKHRVTNLKLKDHVEKKFDLAYEDASVRITYARSSRDGPCLVAFTGAGKGYFTNVMLREEFLLQDDFGLVIWIIDKQVSWGMGLNFDLISQEVEKLKGNRKVFSIGNSMGGYNAILLSSFIGAERVLAFNPQFSVDLNFIPPNALLERSKNRIRPWSHRVPQSILDFLNPQTKYAIIMSRSPRDSIHHNYFKKFVNKSNVELFKLNINDHNVAKHLKGFSLLKPCIFVFFNSGTLKKFFSQESHLLEKKPLMLMVFRAFHQLRSLLYNPSKY